MNMLRNCIAGRSTCFLVALVLVVGLVLGLGPVQAQGSGTVEELTGCIEPGVGVFYVIPGLERGETVYVYASPTSGNLDPFVALASERLDWSTLREEFIAEVEVAIVGGRDPLEAIPEIADDFFVVWDDDSGEGYDAAFEFVVPADGDYQLLVTKALAADSFGDYRLLIGLDAPDVLTGQAEPTGDRLVILDKAASRIGVAVEEVTGTFTADKTSTFYTLNDVDEGDTLYVFVEATSGDLAPIVVLTDFGDKPLRSGNFSGEQATASLQYTFDEAGSNDKLEISACCEDTTVTTRDYRLLDKLEISACCKDTTVTTGDYRLLVGMNAREVLTGDAVSTGQPILRQPTEVKVGIRMDQIASVNQKEENFDVVASIQMEWQDPELAFSPDTCQCSFKLLTADKAVQFMTQEGIKWPSFTLFNQQGNRWTQNQLVVIEPDGRATYYERFSVTLQAPNFDFRDFPFDTQEFYILIDSLFPEEFYVYADLEGFSGIGEHLGEEEWGITEFDTRVTSEDSHSRFALRFEAERHLTYYLFRIFTPLLLIILVSWITFFLKDYGKRVDISAGNLLLFIAFNFTLAGDLPRLGYLTLLDAILVSAFLITVAAVVFNVYLKRLEVSGKRALAEKLDRFVIWLYPVAYLVAFVAVRLLFS